MNNNDRDHHIYHAHALGVAGTIVRPVPQIIHSQASTALSPAGGHGSQHVENFEVKGIVSFSSAFVEVGGSYDLDNKTHTTVSSAIIEDLNIMGVVTADRVVARLSSYYPVAAKAGSTPPDSGASSAPVKQGTTPSAEKQGASPEPGIIPMGSYFENLRIAGRLIDIPLETHIFSIHDTFSKVKGAHTEKDENKNGLYPWLLCNKLVNARLKPPSLARFANGLKELSDTHGIFICSPANHFEGELTTKKQNQGLDLFGSVIYIPSFGVIHIAELLIEQHSRRFNMIRLQMGSPVQGDLTVGAVFANGSTYPPTGPPQAPAP